MLIDIAGHSSWLTQPFRLPIPLRNDENHVCARAAQPPPVPVGRSAIETAEGDKQLPDLAPLCVKGAPFPPVDGAPVLAAVKQTALDCGCGSAL
jgi:hypothetical protein